MKSNNYSQSDISQVTTYRSGIAQAAAHRILNKIVGDFLLAYGLTPMQWFIAGFIFDAGPNGIRLSDVAKMTDTTLPYITNQITLLTEKGVVQKVAHSGDSRVKLVSINKKYMPTVRKIEKELREHLRERLYNQKDITRDELSSYIHVLFKIIN